MGEALPKPQPLAEDLLAPEGEKVIFFGSMVTDFNGWLYTHAGIGSTN